MKSSPQCLNYQEVQPLPLIQQPVQSSFPNLWKIAKGFAQALLFPFIYNDKPQIWQKCNRNLTLWKIYDPVTEQKYQFTSEQEVLIWLEERYDRQPKSLLVNGIIYRFPPYL